MSKVESIPVFEGFSRKIGDLVFYLLRCSLSGDI